jgi:hypothetical protein
VFLTQGLEGKSFASFGDRTPVVQSVARHYTDWATPSPRLHVLIHTYTVATEGGGLVPASIVYTQSQAFFVQRTDTWSALLCCFASYEVCVANVKG